MRSHRVLAIVGALSVAAAVLAASARANGIVVEASPSTAPDGGGAPIDRPARWAPVVLTSHRVEATLHDRLADVVVEQVFRNRTGAPVEGVYLFPLPDGAVVAKFAMTMGGKLVDGEVVPAAEARRVYESIVRRRRDPGLLEYAGRGLYRANVFPIAPSGEVRVRLQFQETLPETDGTLEFRYPLATDRLNGEPVEAAAIDVRIESEADLKAVYSPSHTVTTTRDGERKASVAWKRDRARQDRDFLLYVGRSPDAVGFSLASSKAGADDGAFLAVLAPRFSPPESERVPKDVVYVLDTSGSMAGGKIEQARRAVSMGIEILRPGDRFNVITFATSVTPWRDVLSSADALSKKAARDWLEERGAVGGTNIDGALKAALATKNDGRLLLIVFVTDGRPTVGEQQPDAIVRGASASNVGKARVFTFGVGSDLDVNLLDRIAEATGGVRDYVTSGEDLEISTGRFFAKVDQPVLADVRVNLGAGVYDVFPQRVPDLFAGGQIVLFGRYREGGTQKVSLSGTVNGKPVAYEFTGTLRRDAGPQFLPRLWAQRKVAFLLDEVRLHGEKSELTDEITRLATRFAIVTPYTSSLVVDDAEFPHESPAGGLSAGPSRGKRPLRMPDGSLPPGLRGPNDPPPRPPLSPTTIPPPPPTTTPPDTPAVPPAPQLTPTTPADPIGRSQELKRKKDADALDESKSVRTVAGRTFVLDRDGRWTDTAWDPAKSEGVGAVSVTKVEAFSEAYFALLARGDDVANILALGERVLFVLDGKAFEVRPAGRK